MAMPKIKLVTAAPAAQIKRKTRSPRHPFAISQQPYEIAPFFLAPVLPGESMQSLRLQSTVKSGFMAPHMTGWWQEYYLFYVKHRDLAQRDLITDIHVKNTTNAALVSVVADPQTYHAGLPGTINWTKMCLQRVVEEYFRNEGEAWDAFLSPDGRPLAAISNDNWLDSAIQEGAIASGANQGLPDEQLEEGMVGDHGVPAGFEAHYDHWLVMRRNNLISTDFEDYLRANGISVPEKEVEPHRPELLRYTRDFGTPKRGLMDTGEEVSIINWEVSESADKNRFFREPGFLFGVSVIRPKTFRPQLGSAVHLLNDAWSWMPHLLQDNPETSLRVIAQADAEVLFPGYTGEDDIIADLRDLFLYGDQFVDTGNSLVRTDFVPAGADFDRRYPDMTDYGDNLWAETAIDPVPAGHAVPPKAFVSEGLVSLGIASKLQGDTSGYGAQFNPETA